MMQTVDSLHVFARAPLFPNIYTQQFQHVFVRWIGLFILFQCDCSGSR